MPIILDSEIWPRVQQRITAERARRVEGLLICRPEGLLREQGFVEALDWVIEQSKPPPEKAEEEIYDDC